MRRFKLCKRQAQRVVEMAMLNQVEKFNAKAVKEYRVWVKKRIFRENKQAVEDMNEGDR